MFAETPLNKFVTNSARLARALGTALLSAAIVTVLFRQPALGLFIFLIVLAAHAGPMKPKLRGKKGKFSEAPADANEAKTFHARSQLQVALDQATQAESAAGRANYGDKLSRMAAAEQASYNAIAAREAASRASASAAGGLIDANDAAAQAHQAAYRAQAAADRARYAASAAK